MSRWALLATFAIACGHAAPSQHAPSPGRPPAPTADAAVDAAPLALDDDLPRLADRAIHLYQDWRKALADAGEDCAVATSKIDAIADAYADVIAANQRVIRAGHDKVKKLRAALGTSLDEDGLAIVHSPAMAKCSTDPAFARAIERLGGES